MTLVFFAVDNLQGYVPDDFKDAVDLNDMEEHLKELDENEYRIYNMSDWGDEFQFERDYNDELLDGGWFVKTLL